MNTVELERQRLRRVKANVNAFKSMLQRTEKKMQEANRAKRHDTLKRYLGTIDATDDFEAEVLEYGDVVDSNSVA